MGGPGMPATRPGQATPPGVEPPDPPDRSLSELFGVLDLENMALKVEKCVDKTVASRRCSGKVGNEIRTGY